MEFCNARLKHRASNLRSSHFRSRYQDRHRHGCLAATGERCRHNVTENGRFPRPAGLRHPSLLVGRAHNDPVSNVSRDPSRALVRQAPRQRARRVRAGCDSRGNRGAARNGGRPLLHFAQVCVYDVVSHAISAVCAQAGTDSRDSDVCAPAPVPLPGPTHLRCNGAPTPRARGAWLSQRRAMVAWRRHRSVSSLRPRASCVAETRS